MSAATTDQAARLRRPPVAHRVESAEKRRQRLSTGGLIAVVGVLLLIGLGSTTGEAQFALSDAFDEIQLPTLAVPGLATVAVCAVVCLLARPPSSPGGCGAGCPRWSARSPGARCWSAS